MTRTNIIGLISTLVLLTAPSFAAGNDGNAAAEETEKAAAYPRIPLADILEIVSKRAAKTFLVDARVSPDVVVGQIKLRNSTYASLLSILRNNELAAVSIGGVTSIVPVAAIRQYALPLLFDDDDSILDEEWVTRVIHSQNAAAAAAMMVPIMRPLLPKQGHMAAHPTSNSIIIVARYANVRRITKMILELDSLIEMQGE